MGEIADSMLDGTLCEGCGEYLGGTDYDVPLLCGGCAKDRRADGHDVQRLGKFWQDCGAASKAAPRPVKAKCPTCGKAVTQAGMKDHARAVHGEHAKG